MLFPWCFGFFFSGGFFCFFSGKGKVLSSIFKQMLHLTMPFCSAVIWNYIHTYLNLGKIGKWGFDNSSLCHTEFYDDDQDSGISYSLWIISKTCIDNSKLFLSISSGVQPRSPTILLPARTGLIFTLVRRRHA